MQTLAVQAPTWLVQFPGHVRREQREMLQREMVGATRERMLREIGEALETIGSDKPLLLVFEDLHWVAPSTVDLISALARRRSPGKLMLIGTYRPVDVTLAQHPLSAADDTRAAMAKLERLVIGNQPPTETEQRENFASGNRRGRRQPCRNPVNTSAYCRLNLVAAVGLEPTTYGL